MSYRSTKSIAAELGVTQVLVGNWIRRGVTLHGRTVKLEAVRLGLKLYRVHADALASFIAALNGERVEEKPVGRSKLSAASKAFRKKMGVDT